jgi:hypothetical protein
MARRIVLVLVATVVCTVLGAAGVSADTTIVVQVDVAVGAPSGPTTCEGVTYPTCTTPYEGRGVTVNGLRGWELEFEISEFRCAQVFGTWSLAATDGSGDGLSGRHSGIYGGDLRMEVTEGTGAYSGYVDAVPGGAWQNFHPFSAHTFGVGTTCPVVVPVYNFSLAFTLKPA